MTETDANHPPLMVRGISTLALIAMVVALGGLALALLPQPCPMSGPGTGPLGQMGLYPLQVDPSGTISCVPDFTQPQPAQTGFGHLSATVKPIVENAHLIAAFVGAAIVRIGIGRLWPSLRQRTEQTEDSA